MKLSCVCVLILAGGIPGNAQEPTPATLGNRNPINVVAVGYDIGNKPKAQKMLQDIGQAARDGGASGEVILADKDEADLDRAMEQAMSIAVRSPAQACRLEIKTATVRPGEKIVVVHSDFEITDQHAWIAFYEKAADQDQNYLSYTFLANLTDRTYDVVAPRKNGAEYHFRLFKSKAYDCAARSDPVTVER